MTGVLIEGSSTATKTKRSKYSRNGCLRCKKMKVKCDELKPSCSRCQKTIISCEYKPRRKNTRGHSNTPNSFIDLIDDKVTAQMDNVLISIDQSNISPQSDNSHAVFSITNLQSLEPYFDEKLEDNLFKLPYELFDKFTDPTHKKYFDIFYHEFSHIIMPLKPSSDLNPIRDIIIQYSLKKNYLFHAILSSGARLSYQRTFLEEDKQNYSYFMDQTLKMMDDYVYIQNYIKRDVVDDTLILQKLEPLLLTILLLTSDNASSMQQSWRGHLRGAKELLKLVFIENKLPTSKTLTVCKCWFTAFEILAGLTAPYGGILSEDYEIKKLLIDVECLEEISVLQKLLIVGQDGFNYLLGFYNHLVPPVLKLIELIKRTEKPDLLELLHEFKSYTTNGKDWNSISNQAYIDASILSILTRFLDVPKSNHYVQELVEKILNGVVSSDVSGINIFNLMLLQWPLLVSGLNCNNDESKNQLETLLNLLIGVGSGSAKFSLDKVKKAWEDKDDGSELEVDVVTY